MSTHALAGSHHTNHPGLAPFARDPRRACMGFDTDIFFPDEHSGPANVAKEICRACPFVDACREWAIEWCEVGVWGATTAKERKGIRAARRRRADVARPEARAA